MRTTRDGWGGVLVGGRDLTRGASGGRAAKVVNWSKTLLPLQGGLCAHLQVNGVEPMPSESRTQTYC
jgi:hypothetical protein